MNEHLTIRVVRNRTNLNGKVTKVEFLDGGEVVGWLPVTGVEWEQPANQLGRFAIFVHDCHVEVAEV